MPHTRSAKKNMRKAEKRRLRNRAAKKVIKLQIKAFVAALAGPVEEMKKQAALTAKKLDKAAAKGVIHKNMAARKKSQVARAVHKRLTPPATPAAPPPRAPRADLSEPSHDNSSAGQTLSGEPVPRAFRIDFSHRSGYLPRSQLLPRLLPGDACSQVPAEEIARPYAGWGSRATGG